MAIREPAVAGTFYPDDPQELKRICLEKLSKTSDQKAKAIIVPHAGYIYSGTTAGKVFSQVHVPKTIFLLGPNHRGLGAPFSIMSQGEWETPLGRVPMAKKFSEGLIAQCRDITEDSTGHRFEHSLEVQIPFLQLRRPDLEISPLVIGTSDLNWAREVANACARYIEKYQEEVLIVISTDMNHYEDEKTTRDKDHNALAAIQHMDAEELIWAVQKHQISMCGFLPAVMLFEMKHVLKFRNCTLMDYRTSGETSGDFERVVGYAGFIIE
jgi:hypothetical protein